MAHEIECELVEVAKLVVVGFVRIGMADLLCPGNSVITFEDHLRTAYGQVAEPAALAEAGPGN